MMDELLSKVKHNLILDHNEDDTDCKNSLFKALTDNDFTVTYAFYVGFETDTKYHHYNIDVSKYYETEE